eukprot:4409446-Prorocentrum_lima.AAC.1
MAHTLSVKDTTFWKCSKGSVPHCTTGLGTPLENQNPSPKTSGRIPRPRATPTSTRSKNMNQV